MLRTSLRPVAVVAVVLLAAPALVHGAAGDLDPTFGTAGKVVTTFPGFQDASGRALLLQPDGKIVAAGSAGSSLNSNFAAARYDTSGALDTTFGTGGLVNLSVVAGFDWATAIARQADGRLVLGGQANVGFAVPAFAVACLEPDGSPDFAFGSGGFSTALSQWPGAFLTALAIQPSGRIVAAGAVFNGADSDVALVGWQANGALDPSFGVGGIEMVDLQGVGRDEQANDVLLLADGSIMVAGSADVGSGTRGLLARFDSNGHVDGGFGSGGYVTLPAVQSIARVVELGDGRLVLAALVAGDIVVVRLLPDGIVDSTFGSGGSAVLALPASYDGPSGLVVQPDGRLVVAGTTNAGGVHDFLVARFEPEGALDSSFGAGGVATTPSGSDGYALGLVRQVDAKLVVVAETRVAGAPAFGLLRYVGEPACGDGLLDPGEECDDGNTAAGDCCGPTCALEADTSPCDDGNACTEGDACTAGVCAGTASVVCAPCEACAPASGCVATPQSGCNSPLRAGGARLALTEGPFGRNRLTWTWGDGVASSLPTLGDPLTSDDLTLCIYDGTGPTPGLLLSATAPAGGTCGGVPCWRQIAGPGFRYVDRARAAGGLSTLAVRAAAAGTARATVKAGGPTLTAPALPLAGSIRVQLRSEAGGCWEAVHPTQRATRNDASRFVCTGE